LDGALKGKTDPRRQRREISVEKTANLVPGSANGNPGIFTERLIPFGPPRGLGNFAAPDRELSQLAALGQATRAGRFSAKIYKRAAVWDKPCSNAPAWS
jgi:hypothetical protein